MLFLLSSHLRSSAVSVVFDFSASFIDVAPVSLMSFPVCPMRVEMSELLVGVLFVSLFVFTC